MTRNFLTIRRVLWTILCVVADFTLILWGGLAMSSWVRDVTGPTMPDVQTVTAGVCANLANGGLIEDPKTIDFGSVVRGNPVNWELKLSNPTDQEVTIARFQGLCGAQIRTKSLTIPPGESGVIKLCFFNDIIRGPGSTAEKLEWHIIPEFVGHPGKHPGWWVGGTYVKAKPG